MALPVCVGSGLHTAGPISCTPHYGMYIDCKQKAGGSVYERRLVSVHKQALCAEIRQGLRSYLEVVGLSMPCIDFTDNV